MSAYPNSNELSLEERLDDMIDVCIGRFTPGFTKFLDGGELVKAKNYLSRFKNDVLCVAFGGFYNCERAVLGIFPKSIYGYDGVKIESLYEMFELCFVKISGSGFKRLTHRDFLGSVLGLGLKRDTVGDIVIDESGTSAVVAFTKPAGMLVLSELEFVGNDRVKTKQVDIENLPSIKYEFQVISGTVASFRLDCVLALAVSTSREKAKRLIDLKAVSVNHAEALKCDTQICEGDLLSVRGVGRFKIAKLGDTTKKGRNRIEVHKFK